MIKMIAMIPTNPIAIMKAMAEVENNVMQNYKQVSLL